MVWPPRRPHHEPGTPVLQHEEGHVTRQLSTAGVGVHGVALGLERRIGEGVVQPDPRAFGHDASAEGIPQGLGGGHHVTPPIRDHIVRGVVPGGPARTRGHERAGTVVVDLGDLFAPVCFREKGLQRGRNHVGIAGIAESRPEGVLGHLGKGVQVVHGVMSHAGDVVPAHEPQAHQRGERVGRRGCGLHDVSPVRDLDGIPPLGLVAGQVVESQEAVGLPHGPVDGLAQLSPVESGRSLTSDEP